MKAFIVVCLFALAAIVQAKPNEGTYTDRYDNINVDEIMGNKRLLESYIKCLLDLGKCTPEGSELKSHVKDALENHCVKCTPKQQTYSRKVIGHLINHEPQYWTQLTAKYDPEHKFATKYEDELKTLKS